MLEAYFVKPTTIDRIWACWIGAEVERYMIWLDGQGYRPRSVLRRVPMLVAFREFAYARGARSVQDLPEHVEPFVRQWLARSRSERAGLAKEVRGPVEQMLRVVLPGFVGTPRPHHGVPFAESVPGFFDYLAGERGLRPASIYAYRHYRALRGSRTRPWSLTSGFRLPSHTR